MSSTRIAMWSGPRNISTALMRSFEARGDAYVTDEPLYAPYLDETGLEHPMAAEIIEHHEADATAVATWLTGPVPNDKPVWYQKHMAHHLLPSMAREWLESLTHAFLIRRPAEMLASLTIKLGTPRLEDTGLPQQLEILRAVRERTGAVPPVIDSQDVLQDPEGMLTKLCAALDIEYTDAMLSWPPGIRETDGIWASHWYDAVEKSTGFAPYRRREDTLMADLVPILEACRPLYDELYEHRIH